MTLSIAIDYRPALLSRAGIGRTTRELARALAQRDDVCVHLFGHSLAAARVAFTPPANARLHRLPIPGRCLPLLARCGLPAERLAGFARVFHWTDFIQPPVGAAAKVLTVHDLAFVREPAWHGASAAVLRQRTAAAIAAADAVIVPSRTTQADVRAFAPDANVHVVPFGVDHVPREAGSTHPFANSAYVLCLGTIEPRKNHLALLQAWSRLRQPRPRLVVVGEAGWECEDITAALCAAEREGGVEWRRNCDDATMWTLMRHAAALVYPSLWEGFGLPPLEAMQCGVPVVANATPVLRELAGDAARLVDASAADALADAIEVVLRDKPTRDRLIRAGGARVAKLRWADCAARHVDVYREVAS